MGSEDWETVILCPVLEMIMEATNQIKIQPAAPPKALERVETGRVTPQALDMEVVVLGALMLEEFAQTLVIDILKPHHFYLRKHQYIFEAILDLINVNEPVDIQTVVHRLRKKGQLDSVGGRIYLATLTTNVTSSANIKNHAHTILEQAVKRDVIRVATIMLREAFEDTCDVFDLLDQYFQEIHDLSDSIIKTDYSPIDSLMNLAMDKIEKKKGGGGSEFTGLGSGFTHLDRITGGFQSGDLVIIASRPGMGKTAFALNLMKEISVDRDGSPIALFSLEMTSLRLLERLISLQSNIPSEKIRDGNFTEAEWRDLNSSIEPLASAPIYIDDTPGLSIIELKNKSRRLVSEKKVKMIIVDYLQLMSAEIRNKTGGNREQEIALISRSLKLIAKELSIPIIALSQLSREVERRGGVKRPVLSDIRESGAIEQDADIVMFLYRPDYYGLTELESPGLTELIISKHRHGKTGTVKFKFDDRYTRFTEWDNTSSDNSSDHGHAETGSAQSFPSRGNNRSLSEMKKKDKPF